MSILDGFCFVFGVTGLVALVVGIYRIIKADKQEREEWQRLAPNLKCPQCGSSFDSWDGGIWGMDSDPPSPLDSGGVILTCPHCHQDGYVVEQNESLKVYANIDETGMEPVADDIG